MLNHLQTDEVVTIVAPSATTSGVPLVIDAAVAGIPQASVASGANVALVRAGVFTLDKTTGMAFTVGDDLFWDVSESKVTNRSSATIGTDPYLGVARAAAASGATTCEVTFSAPNSEHWKSSGGVGATQGASLMGITDSGGLYTGTTIEAALAELVDQAPGTITITDDDSAASNGTDLNVTVSNGRAVFISENANNANSYFTDSAGNRFEVVDDAVGSVGEAVYADPSGSGALNADLSNLGISTYVDVWDVSSRVALRITHAGSPAGVITHFDDNGGTATARVLAVTAGDASHTVPTLNK